ncbi:uncharacterized protein LOC7468466 isoform X2 [Populus trichocarpa]|uniref:uncharacterized protein LOC7468466 isoform X2 n=1 Tax=Populus trichocarpa TaxID=3694 RepID=UPI000D18A72B|nr:uncharacterized protein LOC7468466 isoform X2 [Populus trichocarpa]|eukprot:XP_024465423.1 uncharacterized protein LOC7468466 isoform X2 [Populus trichocarpa]
MAENNKARSKKDGQEKEPRSLFLVFRRFEFKFPPIFNLSPKADVDAIKLEEKEKITGNKPADVVKFSDPKPLAPPPLKVEVEEPGIKHPLILLPVYALGGFIVLKWIWARWQERNEKAKKASSDDDQSNDGYQSPADEE